MVQIHNIDINPPLINSSCAWASDSAQLEELYSSPWIGAVTTRTATFSGFSEDSSHAVVFTTDTKSSLNSYGYSPYPLSAYLEWIKSILFSPNPSNPRKPFIISITSSSPVELLSMLDLIQALRHELQDGSSRIAIELNTSCPNIRGKPPPAYSFSTLHPLLDVLAIHWSKDPSLTIGLKLAPYVSSIQFQEVVDEVASFSLTKGNPFAFFTCTNTLGSCLLFENQTTMGGEHSGFALEPVVGGLAGESIHSLSLGNVYMFTQSLAVHKDESVRRIKLIGVGGVTSADGAKRMKDAGACVVGCATLLGREGVIGFEKLSSGLV